jgi:hypothetical protein
LSYSGIGRRKWTVVEIPMIYFPLRCALVLYMYSHPSPLISWMTSSKKTLLHFVAWGRATGGNTNKFISTYPDYPPVVCFLLTREITQILETESSLLFTDHVAIVRHILLWIWKPIRSSGSNNMYWYLGVQQHSFYAADMRVRSFRMWQYVCSYRETASIFRVNTKINIYLIGINRFFTKYVFSVK